MKLFFVAAFSCLILPARAADVMKIGDGPWQGEAPVRQTVDEATGDVCLEYSEHSPQKAAVFYVDFDNPGLDSYDALEFFWKLEAADANVAASIEGYPPGSLRRYYLRKRPNPPGRWQHAFLSLRHDDDGEIAQTDSTPPEGKLRLKFKVSLRDLEGLPDPKVVFRFSPPRLVRYPVSLQGSYGDVKTFHEHGEIGQRYLLTLKNQTDAARKARLFADEKNLRHFRLKFEEETMELAPGESRQVRVTISVPEEKAKTLPPLYSESAPIFVRAEGHPEEIAPWFDSYFLKAVIGAIPPEAKPAPWFSTEQNRLTALKKIETQPKAKALFQSMRKNADALLEQDIHIPKLFHGYSGHYVCKEHASSLQYRGEGQHWCVKGRHLLEGDDLVNRAGDYKQHAQLAKDALMLARMGWLTQDARYSRRAAEILLAYARIYRDLPFYKNGSTGFHARIAHAVLGECWWFTPVPHALDLIRGSGVLKEGEDDLIVQGLVLPAVLGIGSHRISANQQAEVNHAVGMGALSAGNWPLAAAALDGEMGMRFQWKEDFDVDGISVEREMPYHFAAVLPFVEMAEAYEALGVKVFDENFKRLFDAPIAYSDDQLVKSYASLYEAALKFWNTPEFARQVASHREGNWGWNTLVSPVENIAAPGGGVGNSILPAGGYTTLRQKSADGTLTTVFMNFGSPAWRGGACLLDPKITWKGIPLNGRTLRIGYGYEGSGFSYTPAAGNGLLVDGKGGSMLRMDQEAIFEQPFPAARWASSPQRPVFSGVQWARSVALCGNTVVLLDQFQSETPRRFDLISYLPGSVAEASRPRVEDYPGLLQEGDGYSFYRNPKISRGNVEKIAYHLDTKRAGMMGEADLLGEPDRLFVAESQAGWHPKWVPVIIRRFEGKSGWAVTAYSGRESPSKDETAIRRIAVSRNGRDVPPEEALAVEVSAAEGRYLILAAADDEEFLAGDTRLKGPLGLAFTKKP